MANDKLQMKLISYLQDTCALEREVLNMLDSAIANTDDLQMKELLRQHREETVHHGGRLQRRLDELGYARSPTAEITAVVGSWFKGLGDTLRTDKSGKNLRDAFVTEHLEIASYELLERLALRAGDEKTAEICRINKKDEYEMARRLGDCWDRAIDLTLLEAGIAQDAGGTQSGASGRRADATERGGPWTGASDDKVRSSTTGGDNSGTNTGFDQMQGNVS
jgi:ferritin-like metal-binding protein YciE